MTYRERIRAEAPWIVGSLFLFCIACAAIVIDDAAWSRWLLLAATLGVLTTLALVRHGRVAVAATGAVILFVLIARLVS